MVKVKFLKKQGVILLILLVVAVVFSSSATAQVRSKILYIDSYFPSYIWSKNTTDGVLSVLKYRQDVELQIFRMDTKRNRTEAYKKQIALQAKAKIESWQPDVIIASDDNASKYLIAPYFKDSDIPIVFCGLNWDASVYGFPTKNITGMVEVSMAEALLKTLRSLGKGDRIGILASDTISERKEAANVIKLLGVPVETRFAQTFAQLKQMFVSLQHSCDMVLILEACSVKGFQHDDMVRFTNENTLVPTGSTLKFMQKYVLVTYAKSAEEQGRYAAYTALRILDGTSPADIPVVQNRQAKIYLNMKIAKVMGIKFPMDLLQDATLISAKQPKVFYVNSYHKGYRWSDDVEKGLLRALSVQTFADGSVDLEKSDVEFRLFRMDTKMKTSPEYIRERARMAKAEIDAWRPDIIVVSDDNAAKFLIEPFYKNKDIPIVFCGLNWDASVYGFPTGAMTGMVEVEPVLETISMLRHYAKGDRLGFIGNNNISNRKMLKSYTGKLGIHFDDGRLISSFEEWKKEYIRLQSKVDMILWLTTAGLDSWDDDNGYAFILANTKIPVGSTADHQVRYTLMGNVKIAEEQGWWAGKTVLRILDGTNPADIPVTQNKQSKLYLNMEMAKHLGIKFPMELIEKATFIDVASSEVLQ